MAHASEGLEDPQTVGMRPDRVQRIISLFHKQHEKGLFPGGQLVVRRRGVVVIDEAVGVARGFRPEEGEKAVAYTAKTRGGVFSAGKPLVGIAVVLVACVQPQPPPSVPVDVERQAAEYTRRADEHFAAGEREVAIGLATRALLLRLAACGFDCPEPAASFLQLGDLRQANGQPAWAVQLYARALEILEPHTSTHGAWIAALEERLAVACSRADPPPAACPASRGSR
jgi:hypothetical protein